MSGPAAHASAFHKAMAGCSRVGFMINPLPGRGTASCSLYDNYLAAGTPPPFMRALMFRSQMRGGGATGRTARKK
jgi:hypothetical protein